MQFDFSAVLARSDPAASRKTLRYRHSSELPYDVEAIPEESPLLLDTTVYIDQFQQRMTSPLGHFIASRDIYHAAPALAELALTLGHLDPSDPRTATALLPLRGLLEILPPTRIISPDETLWVEGAILSGILARTQQVPKENRRKFLNDALLYLMAERNRFTLVSRNARDMDLLMQIRPGVSVLLYERT